MGSTLRIWVIILFALIDITAAGMNRKIKVLENSDPGACNKSNKDEVLFVKDRQGKDMLIICSKSNGKLAWSTADGSNPPGEFLNPLYDCSAILDADPEAKDGFYWINFNKLKAKKVWCDMTTDGGGFMLIGRKNIPSKILSSPSNGKTVEPYGTPHWSSALGNAPIVDFRVQISDVEDLKKAKGHWYYRLNSPRKLKQLMLRNKGGCSRTSPGIGNIAYVKDLLADKVVTTKFRCSKFGIGHHSSMKFGWSMMNSCLKKPCKKGFAYHHKYGFQTDSSGAFSYSMIGRTSGIEYNATVFVGCDNHHCCGCYGPVGGKQDYCSKECQAKNGGTIIKKVFAWFWVRSSLPKNIWNKCIEYKVTENGVTVWYKIRGDSEIPIKGRCGKEKPLFYDGMLVVPDKAAVKKVPSVEGMMVYRKDNQELYFTAKKKLKELAEEKKVKSRLNKDVTRLDRKIETVKNSLLDFIKDYIGIDLPYSRILKDKPSYLKQLKQWLPARTTWRLCWRASQHGWASNMFHQRCDYKGPTVTIIRVGSYIFGGYTDQSWGGSSGYRTSYSSFIFSFKNRYNIKPFKVSEYRYQYKAIYTTDGYGPVFGGGHDIKIVNYARSSTSSYANLGYTYRPPSGYSYDSSNTKALLAGSYNFKPSEIEVFFRS